MAEQPQHQHDLRAVRLGEAFLQRGGDARRGEVLVFDVDRAARGRDHVEVEFLHFAHGR
jgi:hypothetical protein